MFIAFLGNIYSWKEFGSLSGFAILQQPTQLLLVNTHGCTNTHTYNYLLAVESGRSMVKDDPNAGCASPRVYFNGSPDSAATTLSITRSRVSST